MNDRNDNYLSFAYNEAGLLNSVIDTAGREFVFLYNEERLVSAILTPGISFSAMNMMPIATCVISMT